MSEKKRDDVEWYRDGLRFECTQCGNCCTGPEGVVWVTDEEAAAIAAHLKLDLETFYRDHARHMGVAFSLNETLTEHGHDCEFLDRTTYPGKAVCGIYSVRPSQCRTWPFWPENLTSKRAWEAVKKRTPCPGMNSGNLVPIEKIRIQRSSSPTL
jgi:uncharacterized protein